jgi:hypothetical protein
MSFWQLYRPFFITLAVIVLLDRLILFAPVSNFLDDRIQNALKIKLEQLQPDGEDLDILFLGTSRTNNGFATPIFAKEASANVYNMGLADGDYAIFLQVLKYLAEHQKKPHRLYLEVSNVLFKPAHLSDNSVLYYRTLFGGQPAKALHILQMSTLSWRDKQEIGLTYLSGIYRYRTVIGVRALAKYAAHYLAGNQFSKSNYLQGWKPAKTEMIMGKSPQMKQKAQEVLYQQMSNYDQPDTNRFRQLLDFCKEEEIPVILVEWPTHPIYDDLFHHYPLAEKYDTTIKSIAQQYHLPLIQLQKNLPKEKQDLFFAEPGHLNESGAVYFTKKLSSY